MNLNESTSCVLKIGSVTGILIIFIGLMLSIQSYGTTVIWFGILVLIFTPFLGVIVSCAYLAKEKDWFWMKISIILIIVMISGIIITEIISSI